MNIPVNNIEKALMPVLEEQFATRQIREAAVREIQSGEGPGVSFSLIPFDTRHARLDVFFTNGEATIYLTVADNTVFEIPLAGGRYTARRGLEELLSIIKAVIANGAEETVWTIDGKVVKSRIELWVDGEQSPIVVETEILHNPFRRSEPAVRHFLPYAV